MIDVQKCALSIMWSLTSRRVVSGSCHAVKNVAKNAVMTRNMATFPPPKLFDYDTIRKHLKPSTSAVNAVEQAFGMLAKNLVDVPIPMHIGIHETAVSSIHYPYTKYTFFADHKFVDVDCWTR